MKIRVYDVCSDGLYFIRLWGRTARRDGGHGGFAVGSLGSLDVKGVEGDAYSITPPVIWTVEEGVCRKNGLFCDGVGLD